VVIDLAELTQKEGLDFLWVLDDGLGAICRGHFVGVLNGWVGTGQCVIVAAADGVFGSKPDWRSNSIRFKSFSIKIARCIRSAGDGGSARSGRADKIARKSRLSVFMKLKF
jgi:hypothetical protein